MSWSDFIRILKGGEGTDGNPASDDTKDGTDESKEDADETLRTDGDGRDGSNDMEEDTHSGGLGGMREEIPPEVDKVIFGELPVGELYKLKEDSEETILRIDIEQADHDNWEQAMSVLWDEFEKSGGIAVETATPILSAFQNRDEYEYKHKITEFFEDKLPSNVMRMVEESIILRIATEEHNLSFDEIRRRKRQIAKYGDEGFTIASLCSAGYFDEDRFFWDLYKDQVENGPYDESEYSDLFMKLVRKKPFIEFVKVEDKPSDIYDSVLAKAIRASDYDVPIDFIDVRGIGERNIETINDAVEYFEEHHEGIQYDRQKSGEELVVRIDPDTL